MQRSKTTISIIALSALPLLFGNLQVQAQLAEHPNPAYITFDEDIPDARPATGGINQPTSLLEEDGILRVKESLNGIETQPLGIFASGPEERAWAEINFAPVSSGIVRLEATISIFIPELVAENQGGDVFVVAENSFEGRRLATVFWERPSDGPDEILGLYTDQNVRMEEVIGTFENNSPFRLRIDIDLDAETWSAVVDNELNGFDDDTIVSIPVFSSEQSDGIFRSALAFFSCSCIDENEFVVSGAQGAYDDISVSVNGITVVPLDIADRSINVCNESPIKAAARGRPFYDTTDIDPATMMLAGASIRTVGKDERPQAQVKDADHDGNPDLEGKFVSQELGLTSQDQYAVLEAETTTGEQVEGLDAVSVREVMCMRNAAGAFLDQE